MSTRKLVLDASAALYLAVMDATWPELGRFAFHAPPLMWSEALSGLSQAAYRGEISATNLDRALARLELLPVATSEVDGGHRRSALDIAQQLGWAKTYDAEYVALAKALHCSILTTDRRLQRGAEHVVDVVGPADLQGA